MRTWQLRRKELDSSLAVRALLAVPGEREAGYSLPEYELDELIKALQVDPGTPHDALVKIEWKYLKLLDPDLGRYPITLERDLASDPRSFCSVIRLVYKPKGATATKTVDEMAQAVVLNGYRLLSKWRTPPGHRQDAPYDSHALSEWLGVVKRECAQTGHFEVAMLTVGHVLAHTPPDPSGLWIHRDVAAALNAKDAADMRGGFCTELFNSRGVHTYTEGRGERELADKYRTRAVAVEREGFHRLGRALRDLATSYERQGKREAEHSPFDEI